jgi:hypothetical protein
MSTREVSMVRPRGFEPPAPGLGILCSIQLSYGRVEDTKDIIKKARECKGKTYVLV